LILGAVTVTSGSSAAWTPVATKAPNATSNGTLRRRGRFKGIEIGIDALLNPGERDSGASGRDSWMS
jgi:hypothetical protein